MPDTIHPEWLVSLDRWMLTRLWGNDAPKTGPASYGLFTLQFLYLGVRNAYVDRVPFSANALTFITLLGLVPALAISFSVAKGLGFQGPLRRLLLNNELVASQQTVLEQVIGYVERTQVGTLGFVGLALLILTLIIALSNMEAAFNRIWEVPTDRPWVRKIADYIAVLVICPIFILAASASWAAFSSHDLVQGLMDLAVLGLLAKWAMSLGPLFLLAAAFGFFYLFLPNTRVPWLSALVAGMIAAGLWWLVQSLYIHFQIGVARYNAIYGGFAVLPLFMIWIHVSWMVVLLGAELCHAHYACRQGTPRYLLEPRLSPHQREILAFRMMSRLARNFHEGLPPASGAGLARDLVVPRREVARTLKLLLKAGLLANAGENGGVLPARALDTISLADVWAAVRGATGEIDQTEAGDGLARYLGDIRRTNLKDLAGISLRDVVEGNLPEAAAELTPKS